MFSMQICHLVIGDDHLNLLMLREKGKTRDPNLKDTLLSREMLGEENIPDLTPSPGLSSILTNFIDPVVSRVNKSSPFVTYIFT